ncbi:MAG: FG-GAP repeat domain-containing protein [Terriglobales bacterium]
MRTRFFLSVLFFFFCLNALSYAQIAAVGDLNGDGKPDVVVGNVSSNTVTIFINDGAGTLTATRFPAVSHPVFQVALADFQQ